MNPMSVKTVTFTRLLDAPPATSHAVTIAWYVATAGALALTGAAMRDSWRRYGRHRRIPAGAFVHH